MGTAENDVRRWTERENRQILKAAGDVQRRTKSAAKSCSVLQSHAFRQATDAAAQSQVEFTARKLS